MGLIHTGVTTGVTGGRLPKRQNGEPIDRPATSSSPAEPLVLVRSRATARSCSTDRDGLWPRQALRGETPPRGRSFNGRDSYDDVTGGSGKARLLRQLGGIEIPEDPEIAKEYYNDEFESCSEGSEEEEDAEASQTVSKTNHQDSDIEAMVKYLESVLNNSSIGSGTVTRVSPGAPQGFRALNSTMAETKLKRMRESAIGKLGVEGFEAVYSYLKQARQQNASEVEIRRRLEKLVSRASDCFEVDQLLYFEEQLQASESHLQV